MTDKPVLAEVCAETQWNMIPADKVILIREELAIIKAYGSKCYEVGYQEGIAEQILQQNTAIADIKKRVVTLLQLYTGGYLPSRESLLERMQVELMK